MQSTPFGKILPRASAALDGTGLPSQVLEDPTVQKLTRAICCHNCRSAVRQLHDSAASEYCAFARLPPFEARKAFLLGAPKPACCPERAKTAEGINKLRNTTDGEIGTFHAAPSMNYFSLL